MEGNNFPGNKNRLDDGTLRPPQNVDDTTNSVESSISEAETPENVTPSRPGKKQSPISLASSDPLATALFDSDEAASGRSSVPQAGNLSGTEAVSLGKPQPSQDLFSTISEAKIRIPGFSIRGELGRGAFGVVYRAYDEMLDRDVAIKVPILNDKHLQRQYIDEARKAVKLEHPGIVQTYHVGVTENGQPFVVQKLIEGQTLRAFLKERGGALSLGEVIGILRPVCEALESAHGIGLIHRDLKPENLLIDLSGRPFVADFGLAVSDEEDLSGRREVAGTPLYMSPEQFLGRTQWLDGRSDIWAIGVIFYEALVGKSPFYAESMRDLKEQILEKDPRPIHQRQPNIPAAFDAIFRKCCAKKTSDRFGSVRELIEAIDDAIDALPQQSVLKLMPDLHRSSQSRRFGSQAYYSDHLSQNRRFKSGNQSQRDSGRSTPSRIFRIWNLVGPLVAVACTVSALALMYFVVTKEQSRPIPEVPSLTSVPKTNTNSEPSKIPVPIENESLTPINSISPESPSALAANSLDPRASLPQKTVPKEPPPESPPMPPVIQKPFRVSIRTGDGSHESLSAAIAESEAGDTIIILEGTYREHIVIDKDVKLVGQGDRNNVILQSEGLSCLVVRNNATVDLQNLKLKTNSSGNNEANTIDVESGQLRLAKCFVVSNSFDCVKLRSDGRLLAKASDFQSSEHATIRAETGSSLDVDDCNFILHPESPDSMKKVCIQAEGATGGIRNCRFIGPCLAGIEWKNQAIGQLTIEQCSFNDIKLAVSLTGCKDVVMRGIKERPLLMKNCDDSIWIRDSRVTITGAQITGNRTNLKKGIAVEKNSNVRVSGSLISGFESGVAVDHSTIFVQDTAIRDSKERNFRAQSSDVKLEDIELVGGDLNGLHLSGQDSTLTISGALISETTSGLWIESGKSVLNEVMLRDCTVGVIAGINADMASVFSDARSENQDGSEAISGQVNISGSGMTFSGCGKGFVFLSPGELAIASLNDDFLSDSKRRLSVLSANLSGVGDYSNFRSSWKSIRERAPK
jgi:serine/threonine protein kinase